MSVVKKIKSVIKNGLDPIEEGITNFKTPNPEAEQLATERALICGVCPMNVTEPVDFLKVKDIRIPELSEKMCDECGCTLSYKLRQSKTICSKWVK